jgi:tetratricopeptide (TPR) repeat protein
MMAEDITDNQFRRIHLLIGEGQIDEAQAALELIQPESQRERYEVAYLRAWCSAESNNWDEAARCLLVAGTDEAEVAEIQGQAQTERRRRAYYQVLLGNVAARLGHYEEGMRHYRRCIKFLDERRMNIPSLRVRALLAMGRLSGVMGLYDASLIHYEEALRLCSGSEGHPDLPAIYDGLCDMYRHKGNFARALECGRKALQLYTEREQVEQAGRVRTLLGRVCYQMRDFQGAGAYYTAALSQCMASGHLECVVQNMTALADLRREEGQLSEAWHYCEQAQEYAARLPQEASYLSGLAWIACGKVKQAKAEAASGERATDLFERSLSFYEKAVEVFKESNSRTALRETYQLLAQALEACGRQDRAIAYWKSAYATSSSTDDFSV